MDHREVSEVVAGHAVFGDLNPNAVNPSHLHYPYDKIILSAQDGAEPEDLFSEHGWQPMKAAEKAFYETKDTDIVESPEGWVVKLKETAVNAQVGVKLEKVAKQLKRGESVDLGKVQAVLQSMDTQQLDFVPLSEVEDIDSVWVPTYYHPLDHAIGGVPEGGLVTVGAPSGSGKTSLVLRMAYEQANHARKVAIFSLEMSLTKLKKRARELEPDNDDGLSRILGSENVSGVDEVYSRATRLYSQHPDLSMIFVDFADMMVVGEQSEQVMGKIYIRLSVLAKRLGIPVILLSQLSRGYVGGVPRVNHLRYSGMAEAMSSLILLLYNPEAMFVDTGQSKEKPLLKYYPGRAWITFGKSRHGYNGAGGPFAIQVEWDGEKGWGYQVYGGRKKLTDA